MLVTKRVLSFIATCQFQFLLCITLTRPENHTAIPSLPFISTR